MNPGGTGNASIIKARYEDLCARVESAARKSGRSFEDITIVAVTKKVDLPGIEEAIRLGITQFGENYVQEAHQKITAIGYQDVIWHFIGHLQTNKVNLAIPLFRMIQSVDSIALAEKIGARCRFLGKTMDILLQVHYGDEETKHGFDPSEVKEAVELISKSDHLRVKGLMTIPPLVNEPEENREYFIKMRTLAQSLDCGGFSRGEKRILSMGMTDDFEIAIEEGSNMIRIGRAIFGERI